MTSLAPLMFVIALASPPPCTIPSSARKSATDGGSMKRFCCMRWMLRLTGTLPT